MARRMTLTPADIRKTIAVAVLDDLWHGQPELEHRDLNRQAPDGSVFKVYEVRGFINPAQLGTFGAQQLEQVIEHHHPGLIAYLNGQRTEVAEADIFAALEEHGLPHDPYHEAQAAAIAKLVRERTRYAPSFDDL